MDRMITIIVPVYNEEKGIAKFIECLRGVAPNETFELILVDGGSTDKTKQICRDNDVKVYESPQKGRARQMNFGAELASGDVLYFLHADSIPPENFVKDIQRNIERGISSGCYQLAFDPNHILLGVYSWFTRFDIDFFRFGDQSLFVKKEDFLKSGGFNESLDVMEDQQIVKDLKKIGAFTIMDGTVKTSSRKYLENGVIKLQVIFAIIVLLYYLGVSQKIITDFYSSQLRSVMKL